MRLRYGVRVTFEDGEAEDRVYRFPSRGWLVLAYLQWAGGLAARRGPVRGPGGVTVTRASDGQMEVRWPR